MGASGNFVNTNRKATVGSTTAFPSAPGAGVTGSYSSPYQLNLTENVIYIQSDYVSSAPADAGFTTGFFFYATTGTGATAATDFIVYSKVKGAFAGVAVDGSVLDVRQSLNTAYYGQPATPVDILVKRSVNNPEAVPLLSAVEQAAK